MTEEQSVQQCPLCGANRPDAFKPGNPFETLKEEVKQLRDTIKELREKQETWTEISEMRHESP